MIRRGWVVPALIVLNAAIFVFQTLLPPRAQIAFLEWLGLSTSGLENGAVWQFLTHGFLHGNLWHLLFNMLGLWFAGRVVERVLGSGRFLLLYILGILGGGVLQMAIGQPGISIIGASGAVFAVLLAFTTIFYDREVLVLLFFIIPLRLKARYLAWFLVGTTFLAMIFRIEPWIAHAAHLGGALTGYFFARALGFGRTTFPERLLGRRSG